jgi:hypothetical protein
MNLFDDSGWYRHASRYDSSVRTSAQIAAQKACVQSRSSSSPVWSGLLQATGRGRSRASVADSVLVMPDWNFRVQDESQSDRSSHRTHDDAIWRDTCPVPAPRALVGLPPQANSHTKADR